MAVESGSTELYEKIKKNSKDIKIYSLGTQSRVPVKSCEDVSVGEHEKPKAGLLNCAADGVVPARYGGYDVELYPQCAELVELKPNCDISKGGMRNYN